MDIEIKESKEIVKKLKYPRIMEGKKGLIVLFIEAKEGIVLTDESGYPTGNYSKSWEMDAFKDFNGTIKLSND